MAIMDYGEKQSDVKRTHCKRGVLSKTWGFKGFES